MAKAKTDADFSAYIKDLESRDTDYLKKLMMDLCYYEENRFHPTANILQCALRL